MIATTYLNAVPLRATDEVRELLQLVANELEGIKEFGSSNYDLDNIKYLTGLQDILLAYLGDTLSPIRKLLFLDDELQIGKELRAAWAIVENDVEAIDKYELHKFVDEPRYAFGVYRGGRWLRRERDGDAPLEYV